MIITQTTYIASTNATGDAQTLGEAGQDIYLKYIIFGNPSDGAITNIYNKRVAPGHTSGMGSVSTTDCVCQHTQPTAAAGKDWNRRLDFTGWNCPGLQLDGGSVHTNENDVTIVWEVVDEAIG